MSMRKPLTREQAEVIERTMRDMEVDPTVSKRALRLYMQSSMPCGHAVGELLTCDQPPFGCVQCNRQVWQPIETAPRDRTPVIAYADGHALEAIYSGRMWWSECGDTIDPNYWMPLPPRPEGE